MKRTEISKIYENPIAGDITVCGWVKSLRKSKGILFIMLSDGSTLKNIQIIAEEIVLPNFSILAAQNTGAALEVSGVLKLTPEAKQPFEISARKINVLGESSADYPLQKKAHSAEFLRTIPHLRPRSNTYSAVFRVRSEAAFALHEFFHQNGFVYAHTPIITDSDCEGAGEMFSVTAGDDFFGAKKASLTVSGQLEGEYMATAFGKIYTFGPTFRAEKSFTPRHAAEFWMIEPEIAFADLDDDLKLAEDMLKFVTDKILSRCSDEIDFFENFYEKGLREKLQKITDSDFARCTYTEAIKILKESGAEFEYTPDWGADLQTEHERYLTEKVFRKPVFVCDYPKEIKAFYMRLNDDGKTVAAADLLVPGVGELIGGSQREERLDILTARIKETGMDIENYSRYLDTRRFGTVPHAGFGLGFERLIMYVTGITNIRDVIPFPRTAGTIF
ncbi:MAG: asparagine--tRNA ligase [Ruminococcus sp.]|jgi:asparaginyl-tRNA synthetase|nr:asparagine--tRNA ligase [Ruminococcus sp.]